MYAAAEWDVAPLLWRADQSLPSSRRLLRLTAADEWTLSTILSLRTAEKAHYTDPGYRYRANESLSQGLLVGPGLRTITITLRSRPKATTRPANRLTLCRRTDQKSDPKTPGPDRANACTDNTTPVSP